MASSDRQAAEQKVFLDFAESAGLPVTRIDSREPPEPDILCEIEGEGMVAFELGEVVGEERARAFNEQSAVREQFRSAYAALPLEDRQRIENRIGGLPDLRVGFAIDTPPGKWRHAVSPLLSFLVERAKMDGPEGLHAGKADARRLASLTPACISDLTIRRATTKRPFLGIIWPVEVVDATQRMVTKKFEGSYKSAYPIELVLYWTSAPARHPAAWRGELLASIRAGRPSSPFRRVWCFDFFERAVVIVEPEPASSAETQCQT